MIRAEIIQNRTNKKVFKENHLTPVTNTKYTNRYHIL